MASEATEDRQSPTVAVQSNHPRKANEKRAHRMNLNTRRRNVIVGAGIGLAATALAACTTYGKKPAAEPAGSPSGTAPGGSADGPAGVPAALTKTADVPVGSGVIVGDVVITQPTAGVFEAFSTVCTHAGCNVSEVTDLISCPCHGSKFKLDGTVSNGPAKAPLESKAIKVQGDSIVAG
jgi:Rieske Fe-S protein